MFATATGKMPAMRLPSLTTQHINSPLPIVPKPFKENKIKGLKCKESLQAMREIKNHYSSLNVTVDRPARALAAGALKESQARIANWKDNNSPKYYNNNFDTRTNMREDDILGVSRRDLQRLQMKELDRLQSLSNTQKPPQL